MPSRGCRVRPRSPTSVVRLPVRRRNTSANSARRMKMMAKAITYLVADDMLSIAGMVDGKTQLSGKAAECGSRDHRGADQAGHHAFLTNMASGACRAL